MAVNNSFFSEHIDTDPSDYSDNDMIRIPKKKSFKKNNGRNRIHHTNTIKVTISDIPPPPINNHNKITNNNKHEPYWNCDQCTYSQSLSNKNCKICHFMNPIHTKNNKPIKIEKHPTLKIEKQRKLKIKLEDDNDIYKLKIEQNNSLSVVSYDMNSNHTSITITNLKCTICNKAFKLQREFEKHMKNIHDNTRPYKCDECNKTYSTATGLNTHLRRQHIKDIKYQCDICSKNFFTKQEFTLHYRTHTGYKPYKCDKCSFEAARRESLNKHIKRIHKKEKNFQCKHCGKKFGGRNALKGHILSIHGDDKYARYQCDVCHKRFYDKSDWTKHQIIHTKLKPFKCDQCDKAYNDKGNLKRHKNTIHCKEPRIKKKLKCTLCDKEFGSDIGLKGHGAREHQIEKYCKYRCDECHKNFYLKNNYERHYRSHTGEKPFKCEISGCDSSFVSASNRKTHYKRVHKIN